METNYQPPIYLEKFHERSLEILIEIDKFCKQHQINYFLIGGSLLGVIHFKGFIPWDDDIDIGMLREDYVRFSMLWNDTENYQMLNHLKYADYPLLYTKVSDRHSIVESLGFPGGTSFTQGVFVDVIPFDFMEKDYAKAVKIQRSLKFWQVILRNGKIKIPNKANGLERTKVTLVRIIAFAIHHLYGRKRLIQKIDKKMIHESSSQIVDYLQPGELAREVFPVSFAQELLDADFEGCKFPITYHYKEAIKIQYGEQFTQPADEVLKNGYHGFHYVEIDGIKYIKDGKAVSEKLQ